MPLISSLHKKCHPTDIQTVDVHAKEAGLHGQHFPKNNTIIAALKQWITSTGAEFYEHLMQSLIHNWWKCIADSGDCVEK